MAMDLCEALEQRKRKSFRFYLIILNLKYFGIWVYIAKRSSNKYF